MPGKDIPFDNGGALDIRFFQTAEVGIIVPLGNVAYCFFVFIGVTDADYVLLLAYVNNRIITAHRFGIKAISGNENCSPSCA